MQIFAIKGNDPTDPTVPKKIWLVAAADAESAEKMLDEATGPFELSQTGEALVDVPRIVGWFPVN
ncbi:MAG: hypothetical protein EXQ87_07710 [Alphaproteobacteria bacterium]|nr:hypothetical protein [Alphaproteobacteria bacterium]